MQTQMTPDAIERLTESELTPLVNEALKNCHSVLALSRSPLANSALVTPALVRDEVSPTAEERAHGLRLALQWAVNRLAPEPSAYPFGDFRPFDDPAWRDPRWWRYNILRHRYLDPLHPDDFVEGGRFTETLMALTGIPSGDAFFAERNRAIREVAHWLHRQLHSGEANQALQRLALEEVYPPLRQEATALHLMEIAATFADVFPRQLLLNLAEAEGLMDASHTLGGLVTRRYLLSGDDDANLWLSPALRDYIYAQQQPAALRQRHGRIARYYARSGDALPAAHHLHAAGQYADAADTLLDAAQGLIEELQIDELIPLVQHFQPGQLDDERWCALQMLLADLQQMAGDHEAAVAACRAALKAADDPRRQGEIYRRLGKLYEQHNQHHALTYYQQAIERFQPGDPELAELLKDRGWLHILRRDWARAESDLTRALQYAPADDHATIADIYDALSGLFRRQQEYDIALEHARTALAMREECGDPLRVAKSLGNLGLIYGDQGDHAHAIAAYEEAAVTYRKLGNQELMLLAMVNMGSEYHLAGQMGEAIDIYARCVQLSAEIGYAWVQIMAHSNLAEAYAQLGETEAARSHWEAGLVLSRQEGFDDQERYFQELRQQFPALRDADATLAGPIHLLAAVGGDDGAHEPPAELDPDERAAWLLVQQAGCVTTKRLMETAFISKATATRKLSGLAKRGLLVRRGKGRAARYTFPEQPAPPVAPPVAPLVAVSSALPDQTQAVDQLRRQLAGRGDFLAREYGLTGLGVLTSSPGVHPAIPGALNLVARFGRLPDILAFFALEHYLAEASGAPANLLPEAALAGENQGAIREGMEWIWQSGSAKESTPSPVSADEPRNPAGRD